MYGDEFRLVMRTAALSFLLSDPGEGKVHALLKRGAFLFQVFLFNMLR